MIYKATISKEEIADMPLADFKGQIHIVQTLKEVEKAVSFLKKQSVLGFDTESRPSFVKGIRNNVALIQLSTGTACFLFRINLTGIPESLLGLLANPSIKKIGLAIKDDFHVLNKIATVKQANFIELQQYVKKFQIEENSLAKIYAILFGKRISKSPRLSNWEADFLTDRQKKYAALDAWATREIYMKLETNLK